MALIVLFLCSMFFIGCSDSSAKRILDPYSGELPLFTLSPEFRLTTETEDLTTIQLNGQSSFKFTIVVELDRRTYTLLGCENVVPPESILADAGESRIIYNLDGKKLNLSFISPLRNHGCNPVNYMYCWTEDGDCITPCINVDSYDGLKIGMLPSRNGRVFYMAYENKTDVQLWGNILLPVWKHENDDCIDDIVNLKDAYSPDSGPTYLRLLKSSLNLSKDNQGNLIYVTCDFINQMTKISGIADTLALNGERELLEGLMNPLVFYAESKMWKAPFCPPDIGSYPFIMHRATDDTDYERITTDALKIIHNIDSLAGNRDYSRRHKNLINTWQDYIR